MNVSRHNSTTEVSMFHMIPDALASPVSFGMLFALAAAGCGST